MKESKYNVCVEVDSDFYIFNSISGGLLRLSKEEYVGVQKFIAGEYPDISPATLRNLAIGHMIIPSDMDELDLLKKTYDASRKDKSSFALTIVTSLGCNFDCPYCFEDKHPSIISDHVQNAILRLLDDQISNNNIKRFHVEWYGGEPLLGKENLLSLSDQFIQRCTDAGVQYDAGIVTNGYLLDEKLCKQLKERKVNDAQITLDGPPEIHDKMRPLIDGGSSFWRIVKNLHHAIKYLHIRIRVNIDRKNFDRVEDLFKILENEGLASKLRIYPGQLVGVSDGVPSPSSRYGAHCFANKEFAQAEGEFSNLAIKYGFLMNPLPRHVSTPCTAVRSNELVIGSNGELYKCWESVGNPFEVIGDISMYNNPNGRLHKWLKYDPFADSECRECVALPVCMGGCAHHAMDINQYENRCVTFRHTYREQILAFIESAKKSGFKNMVSLAEVSHRMDTR